MSVRSNHSVQCPNCGDDDDLTIEAVRRLDVRLYPDGTDDDGGDTEWDDNSGCSCGKCNWSGTVGQASKSLRRATKAANAALGREIAVDDNDDEIGNAFNQYASKELPDLKALLTQKRTEDAAASEIELVQIAIAVMKTLPMYNGHPMKCFTCGGKKKVLKGATLQTCPRCLGTGKEA